VLRNGENPEDYPVLKEPDLYPDCVETWDAFMLLSGGRGNTMAGPLPISLTEILAYCQIHAIEGEDLEDFLWTMRILDAEWLSDFYKRQPSNKGKTK
jgi:hypothetical protein